MWKSFCLASGLFACLLGVELLLIDSAMIKTIDGAGPAKTFTAPDWAPWALVSMGAITILHFGTGAGSASAPKMSWVPRTGWGVFLLIQAARLGLRSPFRNPAARIKGPRVTSRNRTRQKRKAMRIDKIPTGVNPPDDLNVIIEVPTGGEPVKYEFDKESGALFVDRILHTPMRYPANYGFVPHTLSPDGDPLDALVISRSPFIPGCVVRARPIGVLNLEDEQGGDEKLICVPVNETFPYYADVIETSDLPSIIFQQIEHFFTHYKDLEAEKWVRVGKWGNAAEARKITIEAIERYQAGK